MPRQSGILKILISLLANPKTWVYIQNIVSKQRFEFCEGGFPVAKQIEGAYDAVLARAKEEFLDKDYQEASLRTIAQKAGTSTDSIYTRFGPYPGWYQPTWSADRSWTGPGAPRSRCHTCCRSRPW